MKSLLKQNCNVLLLMMLVLVSVNKSFAHPGHDDAITISRSTSVYMQTLVPRYLEIQQRLAAGKLNQTVKDEALEIERLANKALKKESSASGRKMYKGVARAAAVIQSADSLEMAREGFAELSDSLLPFFDSWPNHIKKHDLVLYTCKETEQWWLQLKDDKAADPYHDSTMHCTDLSEKRG